MQALYIAEGTLRACLRLHISSSVLLLSQINASEDICKQLQVLEMSLSRLRLQHVPGCSAASIHKRPAGHGVRARSAAQEWLICAEAGHVWWPTHAILIEF